ncbi:MAG: hypothetical protein WCI74_03720, partial [Actinomycetes bacterium]
MKATMFDGSTRKAFTSADKSALDADTPYAWVDVSLDGPDDPQLAPFLSELGFSEAMAAYASRSNAAGMFQLLERNLIGATWAASDSGDSPVLV